MLPGLGYLQRIALPLGVGLCRIEGWQHHSLNYNFFTIILLMLFSSLQNYNIQEQLMHFMNYPTILQESRICIMLLKQEQLKENTKIMNHSIILLRHAESEHNRFKAQIKTKHSGMRAKEMKEYQEVRYSKILQDNGLTENGIKQCKQIKAQFNWNQIGIVLVSPSRRCLQTAHYLFEGIKKVSVKIEPLLFSRITNAWSLGSPKEFLEGQFPEFNFQKLEEKDGPWYAEILTPEMHKFFSGQVDPLEVLESGALQSYFDFQSRSLKIREMIDSYLSKLPDHKKMVIITHSKVLKLLTAVDFKQNGKSISKYEFQNAVPYEMSRQELFQHTLPLPKL